MAHKELTPKQVIALRKWFTGRDARERFEAALLRRGYGFIGRGVFKHVFRQRSGRYVVKIARDARVAHENGNKIRVRYLKDKRKLLAPLAWCADVHVQYYRVECECRKGVRGYGDSWGHNHFHVGTRRRLFDY